jgi:hypothetical protein
MKCQAQFSYPSMIGIKPKAGNLIRIIPAFANGIRVGNLLEKLKNLRGDHTDRGG